MKKLKKEIPGANTAKSLADRQPYFRSLSQRLTGSDSDTDTTIMELISAIDRKAGGVCYPNCLPNPPAGFPGVTSHRFYYLSEIVAPDVVDDSAACGEALFCFLSDIVANPFQVHSNATLIVDRVCVLCQTLTLPDRFTLAGVGPDGEGQLIFDLPDNASAIRFAPTNEAAIRMSTIRDLRISGISCCGQVGINVSNSQFVYIDRIRLSDFAFGIFGETAYSIYIANSSIHNNGFNVVMGDDTTAWRVRDGVMSGGLIGILLTTEARGHLISGARLEGNSLTGIWANGDMNVIENNWFEGNGSESTPQGIRITTLAEKTRVLANLFSSQLIQDSGEETSRCFNMSFEQESNDVNQPDCQ